MGNDAKYAIPYTAAIEDIADLIGILAGLPVAETGGYKRVLGTSWTADSHSGGFPFHRLTLTAPPGTTLVDGQDSHFLSYHGVLPREHNGLPGGHHFFIAKSTAFWIAVGTGLVQFFGGVLDADDCDSVADDLVCRRRPARGDFDPEWTSYGKELHAVAPLTASDLDLFDALASYKGAHRETLGTAQPVPS